MRGNPKTVDFLLPLNEAHKTGEIGGKAENLLLLQRLGMRTPRTFVLRWAAYRRYLQNNPSIMEQVSKEIDRKLDHNTMYAVRSSASTEDSFEHSFAGQFNTVLNVQGCDHLLQAVRSVWETTQTPAVREYLRKHSLQDATVDMAVIVQEMVRPVISGVAFSRNPTNGLRETVVEAVCGQGTLLVQDGATPMRWVHRSGSFTQQPDDEAVPLALIEEVVASTRKLSRKLKRNIDLEWVYDGQQLYWLQMREITTIRNVQVYSNRISREMMAGMIKPLIWSVNIPLVNGAWIRMLTEVIGPNDLQPHQLARPFYYRSYFNMGLLGELFESLGFPAESLEMAWGLVPKGQQKFRFRPGWKVLRLLPRLVRFSWDKWTMEHRLELRIETLEADFRAIGTEAIDAYSPEELLAGIDRLFAIAQEGAYYNIVLPLLMYAYNASLRKQLELAGIDYTLVDMQQDTPEFQRFNPAYALEKLNQKFLALDTTLQEQVRAATFQDLMALPALNGIRDDLADLMQKFGHLCDNGNDFSSVPWRENSDTILKLVIGGHMQTPSRPGPMSKPHAVELPVQKISLDSLRLPLWKGWMLRRLYRRTRRFNFYRERISYVYTYGYGLFRNYFLALGKHLQDADLLDSSADVFYLDWDQIRRVVRSGASPDELRNVVDDHKKAMEAVQHIQLPAIIYGDQAPPIEFSSTRKLVGVPTSRGYCTGKVKVVSGLQEFHKVQPGDILVIPYSDVGWTPLFAQAAGVIAESGGILSHSSIIAREYGIPAIVSVPGAMALEDGMVVSMDGFKGEIHCQS